MAYDLLLRDRANPDIVKVGTKTSGKVTIDSGGDISIDDSLLSITESQISDLKAYLLALVDDVTPQLGGDLDMNSNNITPDGGVTTITPTEISRLDGVSANIQDQFDDCFRASHSAEFSALTAKTTPVAADLMAFEDSAASYAKKKVTFANFLASIVITESQISDLTHTDAAAIHDNVAGEINAVADKATPVSADIMLFEDSAASYAKKKVTFANFLSNISISESQITDLVHHDDAAIHDNVTGEINAIAAKATPIGADLLLIEDSAASYAKKKIGIQDLDLAASQIVSGTFDDARISQSSVTQWESALAISGTQVTLVTPIEGNTALETVLGDMNSRIINSVTWREVLAWSTDATIFTATGTIACGRVKFASAGSVGQTLVVNTGKTLTLVSGTPTRANGEVQIGATAADTAADAVLTINDGGFASGRVAEVSNDNSAFINIRDDAVGEADFTFTGTMLSGGTVTTIFDMHGGYSLANLTDGQTQNNAETESTWTWNADTEMFVQTGAGGVGDITAIYTSGAVTGGPVESGVATIGFNQGYNFTLTGNNSQTGGYFNIAQASGVYLQFDGISIQASAAEINTPLDGIDLANVTASNLNLNFGYGDMTDLHHHNDVVVSAIIWRFNAEVGNIGVMSTSGGNAGFYAYDGTDPSLMRAPVFCLDATLAGNAGPAAACVGTQVPVLLDKDHSAGVEGDIIVGHWSTTGQAGLAKDHPLLPGSYYHVLGVLAAAVAAGDGINPTSALMAAALSVIVAL